MYAMFKSHVVRSGKAPRDGLRDPSGHIKGAETEHVLCKTICGIDFPAGKWVDIGDGDQPYQRGPRGETLISLKDKILGAASFDVVSIIPKAEEKESANGNVQPKRVGRRGVGASGGQGGGSGVEGEG